MKVVQICSKCKVIQICYSEMKVFQICWSETKFAQICCSENVNKSLFNSLFYNESCNNYCFSFVALTHGYISESQVYTGSYRKGNTKTKDVLQLKTWKHEVWQLVALNVANCSLRPLIAEVIQVNEENIDVVWLEGSMWKVAKKKEARVMVDWVDTVPKTSIILFDFELTKTKHLEKQQKHTCLRSD